MKLLLAVLLVMPPAAPIAPYDGAWTIQSVEFNGKKTVAHTPVTIRDSRFVLDEIKGKSPVTLELDSNHEAVLWEGPSKSIMVPAEEVWIEDTFLDGGQGPPEKMTLTPAHEVDLTHHGFYMEDGGQLQVFFHITGSGPSLTLTLRRANSNGHGSNRPAHESK